MDCHYLEQAKIQKEDSKKVAVHIDENVPAPSPRCNASVSNLRFFVYSIQFFRVVNCDLPETF